MENNNSDNINDIMEYLAPVLATKWVRGSNPEDIVHTWSEDGSTAFITVPAPIRDEIVIMQNWLYSKAEMVRRLQSILLRAKQFFREEEILENAITKLIKTKSK